MRMLKKLLLAGAFIGVLGSFGFAQEAKADEGTVTIDGDNLSYNIKSTVSDNTITLKIAGTTIATESVGKDKSVSQNNVSIKKLVNDNIASFSTDAVSGKVTFVNKAGDTVAEKEFTTLQRIAVVASPTSGGSVYIDSTGVTKLYDYPQGTLTGTSHTLYAPENDGYIFSNWQDNNTSAPRTGVYASASVPLYTATYTQFAPDSITVLANKTSGSLEVNKGDTVTFSYSSEPAGTYKLDSFSISFSPSGYLTKTSAAVYKASKSTWDPDYEEYGYVTATLSVVFKSGTRTATREDTIDIYIFDTGAAGGRINLSDFKNYITEGYTLEFTVKTNDQSTISSMAWDASTGGDYVDSYTVENTSNAYEKKVKIKFKGEKLDKGTNSATVKVRCKINGASGYSTIDNDTDTEKEITVYSNPTNSYNNSDRTMSYKVPAKVNTGTESGKDSNLSYTQDTVSEVKGIRINVLLNDNILGTTTTAAGKGTGATVDASTMESIITNLGNSGKFTGDCTVVFRAYPSDSSGNCNKKVYHDTYAKVYKVVLRPGQSATAGSKTANAYTLPIAMIAQRNTGATTTATTTTVAGKEYVLYGLEGQTLTAPAGVTDIVDANGNVVTKIVVSADANKNVYTYAATASASSREGLDKVPKTGQSNVFVYVMAIVVCGAVGYGLYVYNKKSRKSI